MEIGIGTLLIIAIVVSGSLSLFNLFCKFKLGTLKKVFIVWVMRFFAVHISVALRPLPLLHSFDAARPIHSVVNLPYLTFLCIY